MGIALVVLLLLARLEPVADTICRESSRNWPDAEAVAAVIVNRVDAGVGATPTDVVLQRHQFAHGCDQRTRHVKHYLLSARVHLGWVRPPSWMAKDVLWFCAGKSRAARTWHRRFSVAGKTQRLRSERVAHIYWRARPQWLTYNR